MARWSVIGSFHTLHLGPPVHQELSLASPHPWWVQVPEANLAKLCAFLPGAWKEPALQCEKLRSVSGSVPSKSHQRVGAPPGRAPRRHSFPSGMYSCVQALQGHVWEWIFFCSLPQHSKWKVPEGQLTGMAHVSLAGRKITRVLGMFPTRTRGAG